MLMNKMKKLFGEYEMTWKRVVIFAIASAIYTGLINSVPFLLNTSFRDIAINFECWILFAIFIIVNCKSWKEACLKCFVFFLISQPLVYLIEVPFSKEGFAIFRFYKYWFAWTILTIPGSIIAYQVKKKNWLSVIIFSVVLVYLGYISSKYSLSVIYNSPYHLLSAITSLLMGLVLIFILFDEKMQRIVLIVILLISFAVSFYFNNRDSKTEIQLSGDYKAIKVENEDVIKTKVQGDKLIVHSKKDGYSYIEIVNENGDVIEYYVTVSGGNIYVNIFD